MGAWCFADHMGPELVIETQGLDIGPHPHTGLQTVTWLVAGEVLHGVRLWMAQPEATRHGPAAFEHHAQLPRVELDNAVAQRRSARACRTRRATVSRIPAGMACSISLV